VIEDNRKVVSYKGNDNMGKNGSDIEIQERSNLTNPFVIGEHALYRGSPFKIIFPLGRAFWGSQSA